MSRAVGDKGEDKAVVYLQKQGFSIVDRNVSSRFGEIDIIAMRDEVLHFVEVKSSYSYEIAVQNITPTKMRKFLRTVDVYMKKHQLDLTYSIDAVIVTPDEVTLIENITL